MCADDLDKKFIQKCIDLAELSVIKGEAPFGSLIVKNGAIVAEATNLNVASNDVSSHAEVVAMRRAQAEFGDDLSEHEIYSNCEPCPMCGFLIRELGFRKVVFGVRSPQMGGFSRWNILGDEKLSQFLGHKPPEIVSGVLEKKCLKTFTRIGWGEFLRK